MAARPSGGSGYKGIDMRNTTYGLAISTLLGAALLSGCASNRGKPVAVRPPAPPATVPPVVATRPVAAINANLSQAEALWHMRAALNVAALSCRNAKVAGVAPAYNRMLARHKAVLATAYAAEAAPFRARHGAKWAAPYDTHATRIYNFFAMPTEQAQFCKTAMLVLGKANAMAPEAVTGFAPAALAQLEAPFIGRQTVARR